MSCTDHHLTDTISIAEKHSAAVAAFGYEGVKEARQRGATLLSILFTGGSALGGLCLSQWPTNRELAIGAMSASLYWFGIAAYLAWRALRSDTVRSWHTEGLMGQLPEWERFAQELKAEGTQTTGVDELRKSVVRNMEKAAQGYRSVSEKAFRAIDMAYVLMSLTPIIALVSVLLTQ